MKQIVKAFSKNSVCFKYSCKKFPWLSEGNLKESSFVGPDIISLMLDKRFPFTMNNVENDAWNVLKGLVNWFVGNYKDPKYVTIVGNMLQKTKQD